jgi:hypothetical protein
MNTDENASAIEPGPAASSHSHRGDGKGLAVPMPAPETKSTAPRLKPSVAALIITLAVGAAAGRVLSTQLMYEPSIHKGPETPEKVTRIWPTTRPRPMPTFSSNDRSRWATVRALVDDGTYVVGRRDPDYKHRSAIFPLAAQDPFLVAALTNFAVRYSERRGDSGIVFEDGWGTVDKVLHPDRHEYYSSKPPLLLTLVAGEYWAVEKSTGWTLRDRPQEVVRLILLTINVLPLGIYLWQLVRLMEYFGVSEWARHYLLAAAAFGTLVTPFIITFNNHTIATFSAMAALSATLRILAVRDGTSRLGPFVIAGFFAGFAVTNELPAAAFAACLFALLLLVSPRMTLLGFVPAALMPIVALVATNYVALGQWRPAYSEFGSAWYNYEGSHWANPRPGIDFAANYESHGAYIFHLLVGHHGIFSLTPIFLLTVLGIAIGTLRRGPTRAEKPTHDGPTALPWALFPMVLLVSLVVVGFYLFFSGSYNYGGWSAGPRWLMWLSPLWLLAAVPAVEWCARHRWSRGVALVLLALSVLSMSYPAWNPWRHPWIYNYLDAEGLVPY